MNSVFTLIVAIPFLLSLPKLRHCIAYPVTREHCNDRKYNNGCHC